LRKRWRLSAPFRDRCSQSGQGSSRLAGTLLPFLFYPDATIITMHKKYVALSAGCTLHFSWQTKLCSHRNFRSFKTPLSKRFLIALFVA
jgi:hypothetical protein